MKSYRLRGLLIISTIFISFTSCNTIKVNADASAENSQTITLAENLKINFTKKDSVQIIPNENGNLVLYLAKTTLSQDEPIVSINFLVYDKLNDVILYKNNYSRASVRWYDNNQLLLTRDMGIYDKNTHKGFKQFLIDINTNKIKELNVNSESIK